MWRSCRWWSVGGGGPRSCPRVRAAANQEAPRDAYRKARDAPPTVRTPTRCATECGRCPLDDPPSRQGIHQEHRTGSFDDRSPRAGPHVERAAWPPVVGCSGSSSCTGPPPVASRVQARRTPITSLGGVTGGAGRRFSRGPAVGCGGSAGGVRAGMSWLRRGRRVGRHRGGGRGGTCRVLLRRRGGAGWW